MINSGAGSEPLGKTACSGMLTAELGARLADGGKLEERPSVGLVHSLH